MVVWGFSPSLPLPVGDFRSITSNDHLAEFSQVLSFTVDSAAFIDIRSIATGGEIHTSNFSPHLRHLIFSISEAFLRFISCSGSEARLEVHQIHALVLVSQKNFNMD